MNKMKYISALGAAWQVITYIKMRFDKSHLDMSMINTAVKLDIYTGDLTLNDLDIIRDAVLNMPIKTDVMELEHFEHSIVGEGFSVLRLRWNITE